MSPVAFVASGSGGGAGRNREPCATGRTEGSRHDDG